MTWASHAAQPSRTPVLVVEIDLDWIEDEAVEPANEDGSLCYRTPATTSQGDLAVTSRTRRWMTSTQRAIPELGAIPCLGSAKIAAEEVRIGRGLGFFGQATIEVMDFPDDDRREDPFFGDATRDDLDPAAGTYLGKLMARNPWWTGRRIRVIEGWATDGVWHAADAITHHYLVRDVQGPSDGRLRITAAGPLQLLNLGEREAPAASSGVLLADLSEAGFAAEISDPVVAATYPASGFLRIGDEVVAFTRDGADLELTRGQLGTTAATHSAGDSLQLCLRYVDTPVVDIIADLLTTYGGVAPELLAVDEWAEEQAQWLSLYELGGMVSQPTKVLDLVQELLESAGAMLWWEDARGQIRLRAMRPAVQPRGTWGDRFHLLSPPKVTRDLAERVSRTDVLLDLRSADRDPKDASSYRIRLLGQELGAEATQHGSPQLRLLATRWLSADQVSLAARASYQVTNQLRDGRQLVVVEVSAKDANRQIGDVLEILSKDIVDRTGQPQRTRAVVIKREAVKPGSVYRYTLERVPFGGRFIFLCDVGVPTYASAPAWQRDPGWFLAPASGAGFSPTDPPFVLG